MSWVFVLIFLLKIIVPIKSQMDEFYSGYRYKDEEILCTTDEDCSTTGDWKCIKERCTCPSGTDCQKMDPVVVTTLGQNCSHDHICHIENSQCFEGKCTCEKGFVESPSRKTCLLKDVKTGGSCSEDIQCASTYCHENICTKVVALYDYCQTSAECSKNNQFSHCKQGRCLCLRRYVADNGMCHLISRDLLSSCQVDVQCTETLGDGAACSREVCVCKRGYRFVAFVKKCAKYSGGSELKRWGIEGALLVALVLKLSSW